jgi:hypothetical protein
MKVSVFSFFLISFLLFAARRHIAQKRLVDFASQGEAEYWQPPGKSFFPVVSLRACLEQCRYQQLLA